MKVLAPSPLIREAADALEGVRDHVVVIGAAAVQVALAGEHVVLTPTRDVDAGIASEDAERIVAHLHAQGMRRSELPHEQSFTWIKGDLKVQLLRPFHPFPRGAARGLPSGCSTTMRARPLRTSSCSVGRSHRARPPKRWSRAPRGACSGRSRAR